MAEIIGVASGVASLVVLVAQVAKLSYTCVSDIRTAPRVQKQYLQEVSALTDALLRTEEVIKDAETFDDALRRPTSLSESLINDCINELDSLRHELEKHPRRLLWILREPELKKHIDHLQRFRGVFSDFVSAHSLAISTATYREVSKFSRHHNQQVLLDWIQNEDHTSSPPAVPFPGTGQWFLQCDTYQKWIRKEGPSALWCHGAPGVGKSGIASIVLNDLSKRLPADSVCIVRYFCDFSKRKQQNKTAILQSLLAQMVMYGGEDVLEAVGKSVNEIKSNRAPNLRELLATFIAACEAQETCLIIDGVDELEHPRDITFLLEPVLQSGGRVLAASRDIPDVRCALAEAAQVEIRADRDDLTMFVKGRFEDSDVGDLLSRGHVLVTEIVDKADGTFLLAKILVDQLIDLTTIKQMRKALQSFPSRLDGAFESTLKRIDSQSPSRSALAHRVMGWITCSERRLTTAELIHALAIEEEGSGDIDEESMTTTDTILKACVGLVILNREDDTVGMAHMTAYEWFRNRNASLPHENIVNTCLLCLRSRPMASGPCLDTEEMSKRVQTIPFLVYASRYWGNHVQSEEMETKFSEMINGLLGDAQLCSASFQALHYRDNLKDQCIATASFEQIPTGHHALHIAAYWNLKLTVSGLLKDGVNPTLRDSESWTPLHWACFNKSSGVVGILLSGGADPNATDTTGWSPIFWASFNGDMMTVRLLLASGADHMVRDVHDWTALRWAMARQEIEVAQLLLKHHESSMQMFTTRPKAALKNLNFQQLIRYSRKDDILDDMAAASPEALLMANRPMELGKLLLNGHGDLAGLDKLWSSGHFDPPIGNVWRTMNKAERMRGPGYYLDTWFRRPTRPSSEPGRDWKTRMLHTAIRDNNLLAVRLLLDLGAEVNHGGGPRSALHAATFRKDPGFVTILLQHGANLSAHDEQFLTPLQRAVLNGFEETSAALIRGGADVNARYDSGDSEHPVSNRPPNEGAVANKTPLMLACGLYPPKKDRGLQCRIVRLLLWNGADIATKDRNGMTVVHYAARSRNLDLIRQIIDAGTDCKAADNYGRNAIHHFCLGRKSFSGTNSVTNETKECIDLLAEACPPGAVNQTAEWCYPEKESSSQRTYKNCVHTPLSLAIDESDWDLFEILRDRGAELRTSCRLDALLEGAIIGLQPTVVRFLLQHGATLHPDTSCLSGYSSIFSSILSLQQKKMLDESVLNKLSSILTDIVPLGLDMNSTNYEGKTILQRAAANIDSGELTGILLRAGADPYKTDADGLDAFLTASLNQHCETLRSLLASECRGTEGHWTQELDMSLALEGNDLLNAVWAAIREAGILNATYRTASLLCHAVRLGHESVAKVLLAYGADPNLVDQHGWRPIHIASQGGKTDLVNELLLKGADPAAQDAGGRRAMHVAAWNSRADVVKQLLSHGCDAEAADENGWRAIHYSAWKGDIDAVCSLINAGIDVNAATESWTSIPEARHNRPSTLSASNVWTGRALHLAAMVGSLRVVSMLIDAGADVNARSDEKGQTWLSPGGGPTALGIALDTWTFYGDRGPPLGQERLDIAQMLVERGADVCGAADHLQLKDVSMFERHQGLWERLRVGITEEAE